jgi:hypothetical protein
MWKKTLTLTGVMAAIMSLALVSGAIATGVDLVAVVDTEACSSLAVQCGGAGHSYEAASDANHNPIRVFVQVVRRNGLPVTGLDITNFRFTNNLVPAGGGAAGICSEADCTANRFGGGINGLYQIFLNRVPAGNWKAGAYAGTVKVVTEDYNGASIVTFTIPSAQSAQAQDAPINRSAFLNPAGIVEED